MTNVLRNKNSKLDVNVSLAHLWFLWHYVGLHGPRTFSYILYGVVANLIGSLISPVSLFFNVFVLKDIGLIFNNLQMSITFLASSVKMTMVFLKLSNLNKIKESLNKLDARARRYDEEVEYLETIIRQCRMVAPIICSVYMISMFSYAISGLIRGRLLYEGWFPFDWASSTGYYLLAFVFQFATTIFQILQNTGNDAYPPICINTLRGHIHVLCMRVARIGRNPKMTAEENHIELKECIKDHKTIIRLFETISPVIALTILVQFLITAIVLCMTTVYFLIFSNELAQTINGIIYLTTILCETFPVCYLGNVLMDETDSLTSAIYSCNWMDQPIAFRKSLLIFTERSQRTNVILAGGIAPITLQTFIDIIRFSISMFTVLSQLQ